MGKQKRIHALYQGRKIHYRRQSEVNSTRVILGVCKESGCSRKTLDSDFCRSCMAKMKNGLDLIHQGLFSAELGEIFCPKCGVNVV